MKRLIGLNAFYRLENVNKYCSTRKKNRRTFAFAVLFTCGAALTQVNAQTVNFNYDASGNVISKVVVQPQKTANFSAEKDTLHSWDNSLAYVPLKITSVSESSPATPTKETANTLIGTNTKNAKEKTQATPMLSSTTAQSQIAANKKKENNTN